MKRLLLICITFVFSILGMSQNVITLNLKQSDKLIANAGADIEATKGETIQLGSDIPASGGNGEYTFLWKPSTGLSDATLPNPTLVFNETITYTLFVNDKNGCESSDEINITASLSVFEKTDDFKIYPNPNQGLFTIEIEQKADYSIQIYSIGGNLISIQTLKFSNKEEQINLSNLAKGIYFLKLSSDNITAIKKLIIK